LLARVAVANKKSIDFFDYDDLEISYKNIDVNVLNNIFFEKLCKLYKEAGFNFDDEAMSILKEILLLRKCDEFHDQEVNKKTLTDQKKINFIKENIFAYACIGIYTHQNISIFHMYNKLINSNEGLDFYIDLSNKFSLTGEDGDICDDECKLLQITKLDYSQRQAIIKAMNSDLVIQGPPGTGKSQTITNIIANAIHDNKKVLFITEKYVAAQVVDKRLNKLNKFSLPLYDVQGNKNKEEFYSKIKKIYSPKLNCYHENISTEIKRLFEKMEQYEENARSDDAKEYLQFLKCYRKNIAIYER
jgi:hypothetical protein